MADQLGGMGSPQLSLSSCSSFLSISSAGNSAADGAPHLSLGVGGAEELDLLMQVGIGGGGGGGGDEEEEERKTIRMMKNRESALRSRARKRAYVQELEKEVHRLVNENLKLKRHCKQLKTEMAALIQPTTKQSSHRRSSST
ncbi:protein FD-like [Oryza brachyantha]|uniref:BZIP domain-containing protein n=1 Tax=Oryza brachyantha TaxID=4533 RepID=J3LIT2_ORYBR|nr:protein FD-like [Oryza brachyantha]